MTIRKTSLLLATTSAVALSVFASASMGSNTAYAQCNGDNGGPVGDGWIGDNAPTEITCDAGANDGSDVDGDGDDGDPALGSGDTITIDGSDLGDINGNGGDDTIFMIDGIVSSIQGNEGDDAILMSGGAVGNEVQGDDGNDTILVTGGSVGTGLGDGIKGGSGDDTILVANADIFSGVSGRSGNDVIVVLGGADIGFGVSGGRDNDTIDMTGGSVGSDVEGFDGDDTITVSGGTVGLDVDGGSGNDTISVGGDAFIVGDVEGDLSSLEGDGEDLIEISGGRVNGNVFGDSGPITFDGDDQNDTISITGGFIGESVWGEGGDDVVNVLGGTVGDDVKGGTGNDVINFSGGVVFGAVLGGFGEDTIVLSGGTVTTTAGGDEGDDTITIEGDAKVLIFLTADAGNDVVTMNGGTVGVSILSGSGDDTVTVLGGNVGDQVRGDDGNDFIRLLGGTVGGNVRGDDGNDTLRLAGASVAGNIDGGSGNDTITAAGGASDFIALVGGTGNDTIFLANAFGDDIFGDVSSAGAGGDDLIFLTKGALAGPGSNNVFAGGGDDTVILTFAFIEDAIFGNDGDDTILLNGGEVGVTVRGDDGSDTITLNGAVVGDDIQGGSNPDTILIFSGTVGDTGAGNVLGNSASDSILMTGGFVLNDIRGGSNADTIALAGGTVGNDVLGGTDGDLISISGGSARIVQGEEGSDAITMSGGSVFAITGDSFGDDPDGPGENDRIELLRGLIGLDVWGQGGDDTIIQAGADIADSIRAGNDDDLIILADGIIGSGGVGDRSVFGNLGSDRGVVTGIFDFANLTGILAGDDGGGDLGDDTLNFEAWIGDVDADDLQEWNHVNLALFSDVTFTGGVLETDGPSDIQVFIDDTSRMFLSNDLTIEGNLANEGGIDLSTMDPTQTNTLFVDGDYVAASALKLDTFLNDGTPDITDQLIIEGNAGGQTDLTIVEDPASPGGLTGFGPTDGILVVAAETSDPDAFSLTNADLVAGNFEYELVNPAGQPVGQSNWYLQSDWLDQIYVYENLPGAMQTIGSALTGQLVERVGVRSAVPSALTDADGNPVRGGAPVDTALWARAVGLSLESDGDIDSTTNGSFDQTIGFIQGGGEVVVSQGQSGRLLIGALGHWGTSTLDADNSRGADAGSANFDFYGGGLTATWYGTSGLYLDAVAQYTAYDIDITTATRWPSQSTDGWGVSVSGEAGYRIPIGATAALVPQGQLTWQTLDFDDFTDPDGVRVSYEDDDSLVGRLGVAFENSAAIGSSLATGYVEANVMYEFLGDNSVNTFTTEGGNIALSQQTREAWVEVGFGGTIAVVEGVSLYGEVDYALPLDGGVRGVQALAGIRVNLNPPPPPPPAPVIELVAETAFIVFFDWDRADLTPEANLVLDDVVVVANQSGYASIRLDGYTDLSGSATYNLGLSERRANSVADGLIARGIAPDEIVIRAFGEENPLVPTPDGVREPQNRQVEIFLS